MYPHHLLSSHFLTDEQKDKLMASTHQKVLAKTEVISDILKKEGATEQMEFLYEASDMVTMDTIMQKPLCRTTDLIFLSVV